MYILKQNEAKSIFIALHFSHIWIVNMIYLIITIIIIVCTQPHPREYTLVLITETMLKGSFNWGISKACEVSLGKSHVVGYWQVYLPLERDRNRFFFLVFHSFLGWLIYILYKIYI